MNNSKFSFRVRYGETDQMGVVYHGNYPQYLEMGRVEWLRALGISYRDMEENGVKLPVISIAIDYKKPAFYDDVLTVLTSLVKIPQVKIEFDYKILNAKGEILALAHTVLAFMDVESNKPVRCPEYLLEKLS